MSYDWSDLPEIGRTERKVYEGTEPYMPYEPGENLVPDFLSVGQKHHQVRFTASTHDRSGIIQNVLPEAIENTKRLQKKLELNQHDFTFFELDEQPDAETLVVSYGITGQASREAVRLLRDTGTVEKTPAITPAVKIPLM